MPDVTDYEIPQLIQIYKRKKKGDIITPEMHDAIDACITNHVAEGNSQDEAMKLCMVEVRKQIMSKTATEGVNNYKGNLRTVIDLNKIASENGGKLPDMIQVMPCGEFMTQPYGPMNLDSSLFQQMIGNFNAGLRAGNSLPIDTDHDGGIANGWITELEDRQNDGLWAKPDWNSLGKQRLGDSQYKYLSPEWSFDYIDPLNSTHHGATLIAASLTNRPLFNNMTPLIASEDGKAKDLTNTSPVVILISSMDKDALIKKGSADPKSLTKEERKFLRANASGLTAEKIVALQLNIKHADETDADLTPEKPAEPETPVTPETPKEPETPAAPAEPAAPVTPEVPVQTEEERAKAEAELKAKQEADAKEAEEAKTAAEKNGGMVLTAEEAKNYKAAQLELRRVATEKEIASFIANEAGGKVYPKSKDSLVSFILTCSETQKTALLDLLNTLPDLKLFKKAGEDINTPLTAKEEIDTLIKKAREADKNLSEAQAIKEILHNNVELANRYNQELKEV